MPAARSKAEFDETANVPEPQPAPNTPPPPGPIQVQLRVDGKVVFQQFTHTVPEVEQHDDGFTITAATKQPTTA
jgi:hypothetical protein